MLPWSHIALSGSYHSCVARTYRYSAYYSGKFLCDCNEAVLFHILLYQPEIPPNTGNIIRLCANTGCTLHLIQPLGFTLNDRQVRRAGLDYHDMARVQLHESLPACLKKLCLEKTLSPDTTGHSAETGTSRQQLFAFSTRGRRCYSEARFHKYDALLFGPETRGLPGELLQSLPEKHVLRLPMLEKSRSMNLSNAVAVAVYEAWRQNHFCRGHDL